LRLSNNLAVNSAQVQADSHQEYLLKLLELEIEHRENAKYDRLLKSAGFYYLKSFEDFKFDEITLPSSVSPEYLKSLEFLESKTNLVMYGNVGTGKTFLSIALGVEACKQGVVTRFFRTAALVNKLSESKKTGTLPKFLKKLYQADLIILDEWVRAHRHNRSTTTI